MMQRDYGIPPRNRRSDDPRRHEARHQSAQENRRLSDYEDYRRQRDSHSEYDQQSAQGDFGSYSGGGSTTYGSRGHEWSHHGFPGPEPVQTQEQEQFDPDYYQWRTEQIRNLDDDYRKWKQDRYKKFSEEFNTWRSNRSGGRGDMGEGETSSEEHNIPGTDRSSSSSRGIAASTSNASDPSRPDQT